MFPDRVLLVSARVALFYTAPPSRNDPVVEFSTKVVFVKVALPTVKAPPPPVPLLTSFAFNKLLVTVSVPCV